MNGRDEINSNDPGGFLFPGYLARERARHEHRHEHQQEQLHASSNTDSSNYDGVTNTHLSSSETALKLARIGLFVVPFYPRTKTPATPHGYNDASADEAVIRAWWYENARYSPAIAAWPSGLIVVDVDPRSGGLASMKSLIERHGPLPTTWASWSGRGDRGGHRFFWRPSDIGKIDLSGERAPWAGIDLKTTGAVLVPPALHEVTGRAYRWGESLEPWSVPLAQAPDWLLNPLYEHDRKGRRTVKPGTSKIQPRLGHGRYSGTDLFQRAKAIPVEDVAARLTDLRGATVLKGRCPFHSPDDHASFAVWPGNGSWRCFTEGIGGDVVTLVQVALDRGIAL